MTDAGLLRAAIAASGLSARRFATDVLLRDERTVRRWITGEAGLPERVRAPLAAWLRGEATLPPTPLPPPSDDGPE